MEEASRLTRREFIKALIAATTVAAAGLPKAARASGVGEPRLSKPIGEATVVKSICTFCAVGCNMVFYKVGDKVVYVEGDPASPINRGKLCPKGQASLELIYNPLRLRKPLIRVGPKPKPEELLNTKDAAELEKLLRKYVPRWRIVTWDEAFDYIARKLMELLNDPVRRKAWGPIHEDGYYYRGNMFPLMWLGGAKPLNEEAYLLRKLTMLLGSNNVDHDARKCHSTTVAGLAATFGFGAQTQSFPDNKYVAVYLVFGGNPAEAHPVGFSHALEGKEAGTLKLIVVDPKMGRTGAKADVFAFFRPGSDLAFLYYILHYAFFERSPPVDQLPEFREYIKRTNVDLDEVGRFKEIARHFTADRVSSITGIPVDKLREIAKLFVENSGVTTGFKRFATIQWAMGLTQHHVGTQIIRLAAIIQLVLGNMGYPGGGVNPFRGHNNVQGTTDMCVLAHIFPGYIRVPTSTKQIRAYQEWKNQGFPDAFNWKPSRNTCEALGLKCTRCSPDGSYCDLEVNSTALLWSWWFMNWRRFELTMGIFVGTDPEEKPWDPASKVISDLPFGKGYTETTWWQGVLLDKLEDGQPVLRAMFVTAENPAVSSPQVLLDYAAWAMMDLVVVADIFFTETAFFADVVLPAASIYEKEGSMTNSNRWIMWQDRVTEPPGEAKPDLWMFVKLWEYLRKYGFTLPSEAAGKKIEKVIFYRPDLGMEKPIKVYERKIEPFMDYSNPAKKWRDYAEVDPEIVYREIDLAVDLYHGLYDWVERKALAKRFIASPRRPSDIDGLWDHIEVNGHPYRIYKDWGWSWPRNVRILYNLDGLEKVAGLRGEFVVDRTRYMLPLDFKDRDGRDLPDGAKVPITGETGEIRDPLHGLWRPAFIPGHNFYLGKFYKRGWGGHWFYVKGRRARLFADLFTGASSASKLVRDGAVEGKLVAVYEDGTVEVVSASELGIKYPIVESFYYDPHVVYMGKALFKRPYYKGTKKLPDGRTLVYVGSYEWFVGGLHEKFTSTLRACYERTKSLVSCIRDMISRYGEWYAIEEAGTVKALGLDYPLYFEPAESPSVELWLSYPPFAWRHPANYKVIMVEELAKEMNLEPKDLEAPEDAVPVVVTTNRLVEHFHTGIMTRNSPHLGTLLPEPFVEIPRELAEKLGISSGDVVEIGNRRGRLYLRAVVTERAPKLSIAGREVFVINIPWSWGFSGLSASTSVANIIVGDYVDTTTTMQESKTFIAYLRKADPAKYVYMPRSFLLDYVPS
jgi:formate dehydrogenase major subunit